MRCGIALVGVTKPLQLVCAACGAGSAGRHMADNLGSARSLNVDQII